MKGRGVSQNGRCVDNLLWTTWSHRRLKPHMLLFGEVSLNWWETIDFKALIRYKKASTKMEEACLMGFSGGFE